MDITFYENFYSNQCCWIRENHTHNEVSDISIFEMIITMFSRLLSIIVSGTKSHENYYYFRMKNVYNMLISIRLVQK
jgi:hypothetical protein